MTSLPFKNPIGRPLKYTPDKLLEKFQEYVQWCNDNPIIVKTSVDGVSGNGAQYGNTTKEEKPRLVSIEGFLIFIGGTWPWWKRLEEGKRKDEYCKVKDLIRVFCESYQKEMASAGIFNANIISRLLGLADRQQVEGQVDYTFKFGGDQ